MVFDRIYFLLIFHSWTLLPAAQLEYTEVVFPSTFSSYYIKYDAKGTFCHH